MITKLKLKNFRQHADTEIEFVQGVNTIVGANNSGKSTIPEAIEFALFGSRALRDNAKGFVRDGQSDGSAVIKVTLGEDELTVGRNTKNAEVRLNGELEARYKENVSEYIGAATGVSQIGFRLGHYIRQKELSYFSSMRPGKRYEVIEKMLKINAVDVAIKNLKKKISDTEISMKILLTKYADVQTLEETLEDRYICKESEEKMAKGLKSDLSSVSEILSEQRKALMELQYIPEYNSILLEIIECNMAKDSIKEMEDLLAKLGGLSDEVYLDLQNKLKRLTLEEQARDELELLTAVDCPKNVEEPVAPDKTELVELRAQVKDMQAQLAKLTALDTAAPCPTCKQALGKEFGSVIALLEDTIVSVSTDLYKIEEQYKQAENDYQEARVAYVKYQNAERRWRVYVERREALIVRCTDNFSKEDMEKIQEELAAFNESKEQRAATLASLKELEKKAARLPALVQREKELEFVADLKEDPELESLIQENEKIEKEMNIALNKVTKELAFLSSSILSTQKEIEDAKAVGKEIDELAIRTSDLKAMRDSFVLFKRYLTAKIRPMLQAVASTLFHKTTKNRYAGYELSEDYDITLVTHDGYCRKLASISGSENDLASLCLRLAIATLRSTKLAGSLGFIILDEISGSFDDERTKQTLEGLLELKEVIPQIINITHKPVEIKYADRLFTVTENNAIATVSHL